jgi:hypothetical protein
VVVKGSNRVPAQNPLSVYALRDCALFPPSPIRTTSAFAAIPIMTPPQQASKQASTRVFPPLIELIGYRHRSWVRVRAPPPIAYLYPNPNPKEHFSSSASDLLISDL